MYSANEKLYGYVIINADFDVMYSIDSTGKPHFTPQYLIEELGVEPMLFMNRYRIPTKIISKLNNSHGILEVKLSADGKTNADAIASGRVIGSISSIAPTMSCPDMKKAGSSDQDYIRRTTWIDK